MVKFSKNASDVCAASVRLARHVTGRDVIFQWGYHGFQDWYIGTTDRNAGVPQAVGDLTISFDYEDTDKLREFPDAEISATSSIISFCKKSVGFSIISNYK